MMAKQRSDDGLSDTSSARTLKIVIFLLGIIQLDLFNACLLENEARPKSNGPISDFFLLADVTVFPAVTS